MGGPVEGDPLTPSASPEVFAGEGGSRRGWNPTLSVRVLHVVLWLLVISGPVAAFLVATQMSSLRFLLATINGDGTAEIDPVVGPNHFEAVGHHPQLRPRRNSAIMS